MFHFQHHSHRSRAAGGSGILSLGGSIPTEGEGHRLSSYGGSMSVPALGRQTPVLRCQLGKAHPGPVGPGCRAGLRHTLHTAASPAPRALGHSSEEEDLLQTEISSMLEKQVIEATTPSGRGFLSTIFLVPKKDGGQRLVINLKPLNRFMRTEHFRIEGIHVLRDLLRAGDWMAKVNLKDAYFMLPIREEDRAFLIFSFQNRTYQFKCLPFGLACAP